MTPATPVPPRPGLRERKKARTKAAIQQHALRLFSEQGYQQTTVDQIAEAAEVSPSTFFRYFGSKEETVMFDRFDPVVMATFIAQPAGMDVLTAMRATLREVYAHLGPEAGEQELQRMRLFTTVPELRMRLADSFGQGITMLADAIARRTGRAADDEEVLAVAGTIAGVMYAIFMNGEGVMADWAATVDRALHRLQSGPSL
jgi:AcrR family transcriptional regulator